MMRGQEFIMGQELVINANITEVQSFNVFSNQKTGNLMPRWGPDINYHYIWFAAGKIVLPKFIQIQKK